MTLRVLTVNTHKGFAFLSRRFVLSELREAVRAVGADLVFLQEVQGSHAGNSASVEGWPEAPHYEYLADALWPEFAYGRNAVYPHGDHGNALLSRFPIRSYTNHDASISRFEARGMLHCVLETPNGSPELHAICVHLGLREGHRRKQLTQLCALIQQHVPAQAPLVVAGDFNDWSLRGHRRLARCGLQEVFVAANGKAARTYPARWPLLPLDRIYARNAHSQHPVVLPSRPWSHLSDHAPLAAEFEV